MSVVINVARLGILIHQNYNKASSNEKILSALKELKNESQRLYELEKKKILALIPQSCTYLYDMYTLPEPLNSEAARNLYKLSTELMEYHIYQQDLPENIWRFCVCFGSWLKYIVLLRNDANVEDVTSLIKCSLDCSLAHTKQLFSKLLTIDEETMIEKILTRQLYTKYEYEVQTLLLNETEIEIKKRIINRLNVIS